MLATGHYLAITRTPGPAQAPPEARLPTQPPHTDISWWLEAVTTAGGLWLTLSHVSPGIAHFALCPLSPPPLSSSPAERKPPLPPPLSPGQADCCGCLARPGPGRPQWAQLPLGRHWAHSARCSHCSCILVSERAGSLVSRVRPDCAGLRYLWLRVSRSVETRLADAVLDTLGPT